MVSTWPLFNYPSVAVRAGWLITVYSVSFHRILQITCCSCRQLCALHHLCVWWCTVEASLTVFCWGFFFSCHLNLQLLLYRWLSTKYTHTSRKEYSHSHEWLGIITRKNIMILTQLWGFKAFSPNDVFEATSYSAHKKEMKWHPVV